jgi:hypothetical protein
LAENDKRSDESLDKLILDIKALVLLHGQDTDLGAKLQSQILNSHDESVKSFAAALQAGRKHDAGRLAVIALGELLLASILILAGAAALAPNLVGISSPQQIVNYLLEQISGSLSNSPIYPYTSFIGFAVGALLLLSAFYTLRQAALDLRKAGLLVKPGEE